MPVPPKRKSRSRTRRGRAHQALKSTQLITCDNCGKLRKPHGVCSHCGAFKGREVIKRKIKKNKK